MFFKNESQEANVLILFRLNQDLRRLYGGVGASLCGPFTYTHLFQLKNLKSKVSFAFLMFATNGAIILSSK